MENILNTTYKCTECPVKNFKTELGLKRHKSTVHSDKIILKNYRCHLCNLTFKNKSNYILHTEIYHEGRNQELAVCNDCGKQFKDKQQLNVHLLSKCGTVRRYKCDECDKLLMTQGSLYQHKLRHADKRRYMCRFCAKTFFTDGQCTIHERKHTKEKAFICDVCNKGFSHRQSLITHTTIHTGVKPFACESCHSEFSCIGNLLKHRRTHSNTCGKLPLTSHRIDNTDTKLKLQLNTPSNVKLKEKKKKTILLSILNDHKNIITDKKNHLSNLTKSKLNKTTDNDNGLLPKEDDDNMINQTNNFKVKSEIDDNVPELLSSSNDNNNDNTVFENDVADHVVKSETDLDTIKSELDNDHIYMDDNNDTNVWIKEESLENEINDNNDNGVIMKSEIDVQLNCIEQQQQQQNDDNDLLKSELSFNDHVDHDNESNSESVYSLDLQTRLRKHVKRNVKKIVDSSESIKCKYCDRIYQSDSHWFKRHLKRHEQQQSDTKQYKCTCCKQVFSNKVQRNEHQQKEHSDILHCNICDKTFNHIYSIQDHNKYYHKGIKRKIYTYICENCGRADFKSKTLLQQHKLINKCNDQIKPFQCTTCMKYFTNKYTLHTHIIKLHHTNTTNNNNDNNNGGGGEGHGDNKGGIQTFKCTYCLKSFLWKGQLKIHTRSHTGEKPFKCQYCPKSFAYRESLITHNSIHTGIKPHLCLSCGARFSCIGNLIKHKRTHSATCGDNAATTAVATDNADDNDKNTMDAVHKLQTNIKKIRSDSNHVNMLGVHIKKMQYARIAST